MVGNFISYRIKKDAPLWMRTRAKGNHCLTASRSARVCARAHTFYGKKFFHKKTNVAHGASEERAAGGSDAPAHESAGGLIMMAENPTIKNQKKKGRKKCTTR